MKVPPTIITVPMSWNRNITSDVSTNQDREPSGNNGYCIVFQNAGLADAPSDQDDGTGGNNGYCIIA